MDRFIELNYILFSLFVPLIGVKNLLQVLTIFIYERKQ